VPYFQICHFAIVSPSVVQTKLNTGALYSLQTLPFPTVPISFSYSNAFVAKHRVYRKYKNSQHPACVRSSRKASGKVNNNFEKKLAENIKKDSKSFFAYVCGRSQATRKVGPLTDNGGKLVESSDGMSELFNE